MKNYTNDKLKVSLIGLGYVGLPIAVAFAEAGVNTIGFDQNEKKIREYQTGFDPTNEVGTERLGSASNLEFTDNPQDLKSANFHIIAVPTPVNSDHMPDLQPIKGASEAVGRALKPGDIVVYESTVYPGVTEEICVPIIEKESGLKCGVDFKVGYSPERINPGDREHRLDTIVKIVSGMDAETLEQVAEVYGIVAKAGVYKASSIKVAEAAKVIENSQRDINIAFMNELALIFDKMGIDTKEVLQAASTKWNFLSFSPGLVGGHCIGVDPYYLTYKAERLGYSPEVILAGRKINDSMGKIIAEKTIKKLIEADVSIKGARVLILGVTFKENCPDVRNSKVFDIIAELEEYGIEPLVMDAQADPLDVLMTYGVQIASAAELDGVDAIIISVAHEEYKNTPISQWKSMFKHNKKEKVLIDVKGILEREKAEEEFLYWRL